VAPQDSQNYGGDFAKRKPPDAEFAGNCLLRMVIIGTVINSLLRRLTVDPAGMHCPSWDEAFVFSFFFCLSRSESGAPYVRAVHCSNKHCVAIYWPISMWFAAFLQQIAISYALHSSHNRATAVGSKNMVFVFFSHAPEAAALFVRG